MRWQSALCNGSALMVIGVCIIPQQCGPLGCGDYMGTTWRQHQDNVETTWGTTRGPWGCGDNMGTTWGPRGCRDYVGTTWRQHWDNMRTIRRQHGGNMGTMGMWRPHGDNVETRWGPWGCGDHMGTTWR